MRTLKKIGKIATMLKKGVKGQGGERIVKRKDRYYCPYERNDVRSVHAFVVLHVIYFHVVVGIYLSCASIYYDKL